MTYLIINLLTIFVPMLRSFEQRINMVNKWKALFPAIFIVGFIFILWDILFTQMGVWGFTEEHLIGINLFGLPLEEMLFFLTIPYACLFIYEVLNYLIKRDFLGGFARPLFLILSGLLLGLGFHYIQKCYTSVTFLLTSGWLLFLVWRNPSWLGRFLISYLVALIPFFIVNGVLTGTGLDNPVVWYDNSENLGIRLGTIPVEDIIYTLLLLSGNVYFYEFFSAKSPVQQKV
ncbi:lycopene cyclase domain-containing protein [bacterium]|nr:lycopene cyclase domain-containing protein [bacterium]